MLKQLLNSLRLRVVMLASLFCMLCAQSVWAQTPVTVSMTSFSEISGNVGGDSNISYEAAKGSAATAPAVNSNEIRVYQNGGTFTVTANNDVKINSVTLGSSMGTTVTYSIDGGAASSNQSISANGTITVNNLNCTSVLFTCTGTTKNTRLYVNSLSVTYSTSGSSSAVATTTTIDDSYITNTDVYTSATAGSLSATVKDNNNTAINGATVTWSGDNDDVATIDASTGDVTLVGAGTVTFTASYAGVTNEYLPSSDTYEMTVTSSAPYVQPTEFDIALNNTLFGTTYNGSASGITDETPISGSQDNVTVTYAGSGNHYVNNSQIRFYPNNNLTFEAPSGYVIKKIVFASVSGGTWATTITINASTGTYTSSTKTWEGEAASVVFSGSGSSRCDMSKATITIGVPSNDPSVSADDVNIAYDATSSSISYTINNVPTPAGTLTAAVTAGNEGNWLTIGTVNSTAVSFTCSANEANTERTATVTLTYTYGDNETVTKDVTVTQAAAPVIYTTIPALFAAATSTATDVNVTFGGWVVSAVHNNNAYLTDNQGNGLIIYAASHGFQVNDVLTGTVSCKLQLYRGSAELTELTSSTTGLTVTSNGTVSEQNIAISELGGVNTAALLTYEGLTFDGTHLVDANSNTITPYNTLYNYNAFESGKTYNVTGIYLQYNATKELLPRSADDIEEVVVTTPSITVTPNTVNATSATADGTLDITYANLSISDMTDFAVQFYDAQENELQSAPNWLEVLVAEQDPNVGEGYVVSYTVNANDGEARTAYFKVFALGNNDYVYSNLVTVSQAAYVPDYATLPFSFNGGKGDIEGTSGLTHSGLGTDYSAATNPTTKLKFDGTGDYLVLKLKQDEDPGMVRFEIKGNGFSGGTFTVQTSADGESYSNLKVYTELADTYENLVLDPTVRYIKWVYTNKSSGNVGLGDIQVSKRQNVSVSSAKYATFSSTNPIDFTEEDHVYAYIAKATANGEEITFERTYKVPANTGVLLYSENGAVSLSMPILLGNVSDVTGNLFVAATEEIASLQSESDNKVNYILNNGGQGIGFYKAAGQKVGAGKAYLAVPGSTNIRGFISFDFSDPTTGVAVVKNELQGEAAYDMQGRRVNTPKNGLYIINGKKVLVK